MRVKVENLEFDWKVVARNNSIRGVRYYLLKDEKSGFFRGVKENTNPNDKAFRGKVTEWLDRKDNVIRIEDTCFVHGKELDIFNKEGFELEHISVTDGGGSSVNLSRVKEAPKKEEPKKREEIGVKPAAHVSSKSK